MFTQLLWALPLTAHLLLPSEGCVQAAGAVVPKQQEPEVHENLNFPTPTSVPFHQEASNEDC